MIYKNTTYKLNEDFDFGKVKSKRIEDDYYINPKLLRKILSKSCNIIDIIDPKILELFPMDITKADIRQYPNIGQCFGIIENQVFGYNNSYVQNDMGGWYGWLESIMFNLKFTEYEMSVEEAVNNIEYGNMFIDMLNILTEGQYSKDSKRITSNSITWWESPDRAYIVVEYLYYNYEDKPVKFIGCHDFDCGSFICFTGLNDLSDYNKRSINEDFDFSSIKSKRIEDDYQVTYSSIRTNNKIKLSNITTCLYNWPIPARFQKYKGYNNTVGQFCVASKNYIGYYGSRQELTKNEIMELQNAGFTEHIIHRDLKYNKAGIIEPWLSEILDSLLPIEDGSSYFDTQDKIDVKYWLSPDEGIVIIYYICYNMAPENKCFYGKISFYPIFAYTGLVQYSLNQQDKNKLKETNKLKKTLSRASTFFRTMYTRLGRSWLNYYTKYFIPKICNDGHLISVFNSITGCKIDNSLKDITIEDIFFNYDISNGLPPAVRKFYYYDKPNMPNILHKYNPDTNEVIAGYMTMDKCMCLYYITNYDLVCKLIGKENALYIKKTSFHKGDGQNKDELITAYIFWYVTDLGMELFDLYNKREVSADDIKSDNVDNKFKKFKA